MILRCSCFFLNERVGSLRVISRRQIYLMVDEKSLADRVWQIKRFLLQTGLRGAIHQDLLLNELELMYFRKFFVWGSVDWKSGWIFLADAFKIVSSGWILFFLRQVLQIKLRGESSFLINVMRKYKTETPSLLVFIYESIFIHWARLFIYSIGRTVGVNFFHWRRASSSSSFPHQEVKVFGSERTQC